jgi:hypothetical protein
MKSLYVIWQEPQTKSWLPVGKLTYNSDKQVYQFTYTKGASISPRFIPFGRMKNLHKQYFSVELFPLFANRLLRQSRPEYPAYLQWLNVSSKEQNEPLLLLARSGGRRATDLLEVFPYPERNVDGNYEFYFFSRELRRLPKENFEKINLISPGEQLRLVSDSQNKCDTGAIALQSGDLVGYCPPYLAKNFSQAQKKMNWSHLTVVKVNREAPSAFRLLCRWVFNLPENFQLFLGKEFQELYYIESTTD